jgi:chromosome segregation ATPase
MSNTPYAVPLVEQLKSVPIEGRHLYQVCDIRHKNIPYGELCHSAASEIERLQRERDEAREMQVKALRERELTEREVDAMLERAIKAERELDEAQAVLDDIEEYGTEEINAAVDLRQQLGAALRELSELKSEKEANHQCLLMMERDIYKAREERDKSISVAERLVDYAHQCLAKLESWGHGYQRYEDEMDSIREDIAAYKMMKEALK